MQRVSRWLKWALIPGVGIGSLGLVAAISAHQTPTPVGLQDEQVARGRQLALTHACSACHSGVFDPSTDGYLAGSRGPETEFNFAGIKMRPPNLTPDMETGIGRYSDRQIFNALRFGLRPQDTPDVEITSRTPGQGNFPVKPRYVGPPMPWPAWRHMKDEELWAIVAYLKRAVKPVRNPVQENNAPPDLWAEGYTGTAGTYPAAPFPTSNEVAAAGADEPVQRGRTLVFHHDCGGCHGGGYSLAAGEGWLAGAMTPADTFMIGPFITRARNLTPDNSTGMGRFTERQIFNALRYGLRPGETPDVEITSTVPGQGNFPAHPKYLAPPMPWPAFRHMSDQELRDIAAYLKRGIKPVRNRVLDSDGPPDFWAGEYTPQKIGPFPAAPYPTAKEQR